MSELTRETVLSHLKLVPHFRSYSRRDLGLLASRMTEENVWKGTPLITEGQTNHRFFVILDGEVEVTRGEKVVGVMGPGAFFGEISLVDLVPATATVVAKTSCTLLELTHQAFLEILRKEGHLDRDVRSALNSRR